MDSDASAFTFAAYGCAGNRLTGLGDLLAEVSRRAAPAFGVVVGDTVSRATPGRYRLLLGTVARAAANHPVRYVPGPLDGAAPRRGGDPFSEHLGPRTWWFQQSGVLFVGVDESGARLTPESLGTIARAGTAVERIVVFAHEPYFVADCDGPDAAARRRRLAELRQAFRGRRIDAVITGCGGAWQDAADDIGTRHVVAAPLAEDDIGARGREARRPRADAPAAAVVEIAPGALRVRRVQVPCRTALADAVRLFVVRAAADPLARITADDAAL